MIIVPLFHSESQRNAKISVSQVVDEDHDDVGPVGGVRRGGEQREKGARQEGPAGRTSRVS
jgi:hypothetical protein